MPAVHISRERAREVLCKNNIYQVTSGVVQYQLTHKKRPGVYRANKIGGWVVDVLPFLEQQNLYNRIAKGTNVQQTPEFLRVPPTILQCARTTILDKADETQLWRGHYTLVCFDGGKIIDGVYDSPVDLKVTWVEGPEMDYQRF